METYRIDKEKISSYVNRETKKVLSITGYVFGSFLFIISIISFNTKFYTLLIYLPILFAFITIILLITLNLQITNRAECLIYSFNTTGVSAYLDKGGLNTMNNIGYSRNEARYGTETNTFITYQDIEATEIKKHEIIVKSVHYNFLNGNGAIKLPKEIEHYDSIKQHIMTNREKFKVQNIF